MKMKALLIFILLTVCCVGNIFAQTDRQNLYGILVDNTGSMRTQLRKIKEIGVQLAKELKGKGQIAIFNLQTTATSKTPTSELKIGLMWEQDQNKLTEYINSISIVVGQTALYDSMSLALNLTKSKFEREKGNFSEKVLILITDGEDRVSKISQKELIKFAKENEIKVFAIGLIEDLTNEGGFTSLSPREKATNFLTKITKETKGQVVFPKSKQKVEDIIKDIFAENKKNSN